MRRARPLLSAELVLILGLLALVGIGLLAERWLFAGSPAPVGVPAALAIAAAPAGIWFLALRAHERANAGSLTVIVWLFAIGAFIAGPAISFIIERITSAHPLAPPRLPALGLDHVIATFAVVGLGHELAKYLVARCAAFYEDGEPLVILIYTTAVALGFAAHEVYRELMELGAIPPGAGATRAAALPLASAACAAFTACALIAIRTRSLAPPQRVAIIVAGVGAAAAAHGAFLLAHAAIEADGLAARPGQASAAMLIAAATVLVGLTLAAAWLGSRPAPAVTDDSDRVEP